MRYFTKIKPKTVNLENNSNLAPIEAVETKSERKKVFLEKKKSEKIKDIFLEWSLRSNLDCFVKIFEYKSKPLACFIWTLVLIGSSGFTFWSISKIILEYFNYEVISKTTMVYENPTKFPTITICDNNPFTSIQAQMLFEAIIKKSNLSPSDPNIFRFAKMRASSRELNDAERKRLGFDLQNKLKSCSFAGQECNANDFLWYWSFDYGNCWQFNSGFKPHNQKVDLLNAQIGIDFGLQLLIYPLENLNKYPSTNDNGLVVMVHNSSFKPLKSDSIFAKPGEKTHILVKRTITHKTPFPYSECIDLNGYSSRLYNFIIGNNLTYRQQDCIYLCFQEISIEKCGCIFSAFQDLGMNARYCMNATEGTCFKNQYFNFTPKECIKNSCPLECDSIAYDTEISSLASPSIQTYNYFYFDPEMNRSLINYETFKSKMVQLNIYCSSFQYTDISYAPKISAFELFSQIGGTLSCLISLSVFTFFEILEILILIFNACFFSKSQP